MSKFFISVSLLRLQTRLKITQVMSKDYNTFIIILCQKTTKIFPRNFTKILDVFNCSSTTSHNSKEHTLLSKYFLHQNKTTKKKQNSKPIFYVKI